MPLASAAGAPEAFEVDASRFAELPGGKEADGIVGDFVLRNDLVEAVVAGNLPFRKANMSTFWGAGGTTQGCLYDLTLRGEDNDQLTIFAPLGLKGGVSYVRVVDEPAGGEAAVETVITAAKGGGLYTRHRYRLRDGWRGLLVSTTLRNETKLERTVRLRDSSGKFLSGGKGRVGDIEWADAVDPADKCGYAYRWEWEGGEKPAEVVLGPGEEVHFDRFVAVGTSPLDAVGTVLARSREVGEVSGVLGGPDGAAVATATLTAFIDGTPVRGYPDADGRFAFLLPKGRAQRFAVSDIGRGWSDLEIDVGSPGARGLEIALPAASAIVFAITDGAGVSIPCKAQFHGVGGTKSPDLGPENRAHGCVDQYHSESGSFRVQVPPGKYRVVVTRGMEYSHLEEEVEVPPGVEVRVAGALERLVDTAGWLSTDYHNHSTPSGDNTCGTPDRVINMAAEHLEFVPTTEHNRFYDWGPTIGALGLGRFMATVPGVELTGSGAHFNAFPFKPDPAKQDGGAPQWSKDPRLNAITLRHFQNSDPDRWVHLNHPDMEGLFVDWDGDGVADGGYANLGSMLDGLETQNYRGNDILAGVPYRIDKDIRRPGGRVRYVREFIWLQALNQGHRVWGIAVSDAHTVYGNGAGAWRTYVRSSTDEPAEADWRELSRNSKAGQMVLTNGPYLEVRTADGALPGADVHAPGGKVALRVKVQCTDWIDIDRVQVLVDGAQPAGLNFTRADHGGMFGDGVVKFEQEIEVELERDAHLIVVAIGEGHGLEMGYGTSPQSKMNPCAYHNPIFVDVDGDGFEPSGDTIGHPLPVQGLTVDRVKELLGG